MKIGAYYYHWYRGDWLKSTPYANDPPILGQYDNTQYGQAVSSHFASMKEAGLDFAIISWEPHSDYGYVMDAATEAGVKICVMYESLHRLDGRHVTIQESDMGPMLKDLEYLSQDLEEECWFSMDGRPVVMIYVSRNFKDENAFGDMRKALGRDVFLAGDEAFWHDPSTKRLRKLDAAFTYNWFQGNRFSGEGTSACDKFLDNVVVQARKWALACRSCGTQYWPVAMPGYDDTNVRAQMNHPKLPRMDGHMFSRSLGDAADLKPYAMTICSFNEHYEGTGIEPMGSYGTRYLDMTRKFKDGQKPK